MRLYLDLLKHNYEMLVKNAAILVEDLVPILQDVLSSIFYWKLAPVAFADFTPILHSSEQVRDISAALPHIFPSL